MKKKRSGALDPEFSFRFTVEEIKGYYASLEDAFEDGAYLLVAEFAKSGSELQGCGLVVGGALGRGLAILNALPSLSARGLVCRAFGEWTLGQAEKAQATLAQVSERGPYAAKARALRDVIAKD